MLGLRKGRIVEGDGFYAGKRTLLQVVWGEVF